MYKEFSRIYDSLIEEDFSYKDCLDFIKRKIEKEKIPKELYIDLGCGTGILSTKLSMEFKKSILVDSSEEMLMISREKFPLVNGPQFILKDVLSFKTKEKANLIVSTLDIPNYLNTLEEVKRYIDNGMNSLREDGILIFDISSESKLISMAGKTFIMDEEEYFHSWENELREENNEKYIDMTLNIFKKVNNSTNSSNSGSSYKRIIEEQTMLIINSVELLKYIKEKEYYVEVFNGYTDNKMSEDFDRHVFVISKGKK